MYQPKRNGPAWKLLGGFIDWLERGERRVLWFWVIATPSIIALFSGLAWYFRLSTLPATLVVLFGIVLSFVLDAVCVIAVIIMSEIRRAHEDPHG